MNKKKERAYVSVSYTHLDVYKRQDLYKLFPKQLAEYKALAPHVTEKIVEVSHRFRNQYTRLIHESADYACLLYTSRCV